MEVLFQLTPVMGVTLLAISLGYEKLWATLPASPYFASFGMTLLSLLMIFVGAIIAFAMVSRSALHVLCAVWRRVRVTCCSVQHSLLAGSPPPLVHVQRQCQQGRLQSQHSKLDIATESHPRCCFCGTGGGRVCADCQHLGAHLHGGGHLQGDCDWWVLLLRCMMHAAWNGVLWVLGATSGRPPGDKLGGGTQC